MQSIGVEAHGGPRATQTPRRSNPNSRSGRGARSGQRSRRQFHGHWRADGAVVALPNAPFVPGVESAGRVIGLGEGVETLHAGQRVAWVYAPGSYAEQVVARADALVPVPDAIDDQTAAGLMMAAHHFATGFYAVKPGDLALVHAATGGVGLMLTQMIKLLGGRVIARVSTEGNAQIARAASRSRHRRKRRQFRERGSAAY